MTFIQFFVAPSILADIPPPPYSFHQRTPAGAVISLIFWAISATAFVGLWRLIRRRAKTPPGDVNDRAKK